MDTRSKIVSPERVDDLARSGATLVSGSFDPLVAALAEQLATLKRQGEPLVVLIRSTGNPILPARARAELVAALATVDFVCDEECSAEPAVSLEQDHRQKLRELIAHVHSRQEAGRAPAAKTAPAAKSGYPS